MPPLLAVIVAVSPAEPPGTDTAGVLSLVASSVLDEPVSDAARRSGVEGAAGGVVSTVRLSGAVVEPVLPAASVTDAEIDHVPSAIIGRSHDVADPTV